MKRILKCCLCAKEVKVGNYGIKAKKLKRNIVFRAPFSDGDYKCAVCRMPKKEEKKEVVK